MITPLQVREWLVNLIENTTHTVNVADENAVDITEVATGAEDDQFDLVMKDGSRFSIRVFAQ